MLTIINGDARHIPIADKSVHCVVTSPPYYGLRSYLAGASEIGVEKSPNDYVANLVAVMGEVWRVLRDDGTVWLNLGDSHGHGTTAPGKRNKRDGYDLGNGSISHVDNQRNGLPAKQLIGIPWRVAFALQDAGWYLRSDIIWHKTNPMPESVTDRPTKSHEYIFLLTKSKRYYYDADAIKYPSTVPFDNRSEGGRKRVPSREVSGIRHSGTYVMANKRDVWTIPTKPFNGAKLMTDYVGDDGKPYTASPDCPLHGHLARSRKSYMPLSGGLQEDSQTRNPDTDNYLGAESSSELLSNLSHIQQEGERDSSLLQIHENMKQSRKSPSLNEHNGDGQSLSHNSHNSELDENLDCKTGYSHHLRSVSASDHSTEKSKTARARRTLGRDTPSSRKISDTLNTEQLQLSYDLAERKTESNTLMGDLLDPLLADTVPHSADISSSTELYCTCEKVSINHFATYPVALIEPCILAGTSEKGACPKCGAQWVRGKEKVGSIQRRWSTNNADGSPYNKQSSRQNLYEETGWLPGCNCDAGDPVPSVVLDPFTGSGTTLEACVRHGRSAIGVELKYDYIALIKERLSGVERRQPTLM